MRWRSASCFCACSLALRAWARATSAESKSRRGSAPCSYNFAFLSVVDFLLRVEGRPILRRWPSSSAFLNLLRKTGAGGRGVTCFGLLELALALLGGAARSRIFEQREQLALLHPRAALDVELRDGGSDFRGEDRLLQRVDHRVGGYFKFDGAAFRWSDLDGDERRRNSFSAGCSHAEKLPSGEEQDAPAEKV